ncbi:GNAT family N-acetyltransferase [Arthrobacter rhizosphaerae]|uniref:GNAT family N-acetyltransferase n=1 Tax=Arthrobacter rhizosphaerae TaxID=2855490 RepID=UPI001FF3FC97|nr:GNAT family N-acetyltransferase [Arthrobacter rhizosphaerae]
MTDLDLTAVVIPEDAQPDSPATAPQLRECLRLEEAHNHAVWGNTDRCGTFGEALYYWRGNSYFERLLFLASKNGMPVGSCSVEFSLKDNLDTAWINVLVAEDHRRRGIGRRLLQTAEEMAADRGRRIFQGFCEEPAESADGPGEMLHAKSGSGSLPLAVPSSIFARRAGYSLEQVETSSRLALPVPEELLGKLESGALEHAAGYSLVGWEGSCPEEFVAPYAELRGRMSTDAPTAGLELEKVNWDTDRVREEEQTWVKSGVEALVSAALHNSTGRLAAYTVLSYRQTKPHVVFQEDTLVAFGHRGHRLGMLVKIANIRRAQEAWPAARSVLTWNASENRHMLAINTSLGFKPSGFEGEWQKRLDDPLYGT